MAGDRVLLLSLPQVHRLSYWASTFPGITASLLSALTDPDVVPRLGEPGAVAFGVVLGTQWTNLCGMLALGDRKVTPGIVAGMELDGLPVYVIPAAWGADPPERVGTGRREARRWGGRVYVLMDVTD